MPDPRGSSPSYLPNPDLIKHMENARFLSSPTHRHTARIGHACQILLLFHVPTAPFSGSVPAGNMAQF